jgi:hypothetical protein
MGTTFEFHNEEKSGCNMKLSVFRGGRVLVAVVLLALPLLAVTGHPYLLPEQYDYDVTFYDIALDIDLVQKMVQGEVMVQGMVVNNATEHIVLNLYQNMTVDSVVYQGAPLSFTHQNDVLDISLPQPLNQGDGFTLRIVYAGYPQQAGTPGYGLIFSGYAGNQLVYSYNWPYFASTFIPCKDHPSDKADSVRLRITVPTGYQVACNGVLEQSISLPDNRTQFVWMHHYPIVSYNISINVYPFSVVNDVYNSPVSGAITLQYFLFPPHAAAILNSLQVRVPQIFQAYEDRYGAFPFPQDKYGLCEAIFGGGMEHQTILTMGQSSFFSDIVVHESAHEYFGNLISLADWGHIWLNEGFATYSEALFHEYWDGETVYLNMIRQFMAGSGEGKIFVDDPTSPGNIIPYNLVYLKAAVVVHMLRYVMGDSLFWQMIHDYVGNSPFRFGNIDTEQFSQFCEGYYGADLDWFFEQWIYGDGRMAGEYYFAPNASGDSLVVFIRSVPSSINSTTIHAMPLPVQWQTATASGWDTLWVDSLARTYHLAISDTAGLQLLIDPTDRVLKGTFQFLSSPVLEDVYLANDTIHVRWQRFFQVDSYRVRVEKLDSAGNVQPVLTAPVAGLTFTYQPAEEGTYRFAVAAVLDGQTTAYSAPQQVNYTTFPMNQGVLVVDETRNGSGSNMLNPTDQMVDAFYDSLLQGIPHQQFDVIQEGHAPTVFDLANYSLVLWHHDVDYSSQVYSAEPALKAYLNAGGKLMVSGMKVLQKFSVDFRQNYLGISALQMNAAPDFEGALPAPGFPELPVDTSKITISFYHHRLANVAVVDTLPGSRVVYRYLSGTQNPLFQNKPCGIAFAPDADTTHYQVLALGFPLYFTEMDSARQFMQAAVQLLDLPLAIPEPVNSLPREFELLRCYPNPFNPGLKIEFHLPHRSPVRVEIYNVLGQRVRQLAGGDFAAGKHTLVWRGRNDAGITQPGGLYFVRIRTENRQQVVKVVLQR